MGDRSAIAWTDATWNPLIGCSRISEGCRHCYAERLVHRGLSPQHRGLTKLVGGEPRWTGEVRLVESALSLPLRWKTPHRIFVNSLSDLFHEAVPVSWIERIFDVMRRAERHTFQILTKRPEHMFRVLCQDGWLGADDPAARSRLHRMLPLPNVWLGVSVENQETADERIPLLLQTPAAVRFVSAEPLLGPVNLSSLDGGGGYRYNGLIRGAPFGHYQHDAKLNWLIVGGESGPGARPCDLAWIRSLVAQCRAAGVPVFAKQLGARPVVYYCAGGADCTHPDCGNKLPKLRDRKGSDPSEWPADLRVQEFPEGVRIRVARL